MPGRLTLELIASDHCNLTCRQCNHASPILPKWNVDPDDAYRDLAFLPTAGSGRRYLMRKKPPEKLLASAHHVTARS